MMRDAGAREVHFRLASPPILYPDYYGIDLPDRGGLLAATHSLEEMRDIIGADSLAFLSIDGMEALGGNPNDGAKVVAKMKELPTDDPLFGKGPLRADGRRVIPAYLFEVKKPEESKYPWDYYKLVANISPEDAAKPLEASECPLVKK